MDTGRPTGRGQKGSADDKPLRRVDNTLRRVFRCTPTAPGSAATLPHHAPETPHASMGKRRKPIPRREKAERPGAERSRLRSTDPTAHGATRARTGPRTIPLNRAAEAAGRAGAPHGVRIQELELLAMKGRDLLIEAPRAAASEATATPEESTAAKGVATHSSQKADNPGKDTPEKTRPQTPLARAAAHSASANPSEPKARRRFEHLTDNTSYNR